MRDGATKRRSRFEESKRKSGWAWECFDGFAAPVLLPRKAAARYTAVISGCGPGMASVAMPITGCCDSMAVQALLERAGRLLLDQESGQGLPLCRIEYALLLHQLRNDMALLFFLEA